MSKDGVILMVNGAVVTPDRPVRVYPGLANDVTVLLKRSAAQGLARLRILTADGREREEAAGFLGGKATLELGPMAAPAQYDFEAGVVYRRWYRLVLTVMQEAEELARFSLGAVCSQDPDAEWLMLDAPDRVVFNDGYIASGEIWDPYHGGVRTMDPLILLHLGHRVLLNQDAVEARFRLRPDSPELSPLRARLVVNSAHGDPMSGGHFVDVRPDWQSVALDVSEWPKGNYRVELQPELKGKVFEDGPFVSYRRRRHDPQQVMVSPFTPYALETDPGRETVEIADWPRVLPAGWRVEQTSNGCALFTAGERTSKPVELQLDLEGYYAVFALAVGSIHLRLADHDFVRRVHEPERPEYEGVFVAALDMTGQSIQILPNDAQTFRELSAGKVDIPPSGIQRIRFVPVTKRSLESFRADTRELPCELRAVDDWWCYFVAWDRHELDQLDAIMFGQRELGITTLDWAIGRSWVQYPSKLPDAQMFPCKPIAPEVLKSHPHLAGWARMVRDFDSYGYALLRSQKIGLRISAWLAMNRHYSPNTYGGVFTSPWVLGHPEFNQFKKSGTRDISRVEYFFPEARQERLNILEEAARYGPDGIVIGCCRQPPMAGYNPRMVERYKERTGVDPRRIDIADGQPYLDWIRWRADHFTQLLRELRPRLSAVEKDIGRSMPVIARIPGVGLQLNMAQGLDVNGWVEEGLIGELQLDPLQSFAEGGSHDVRPYVELCHRKGIRVLAGVNGTTGAGWSDSTEPDEGILFHQASPVVGIRRAIGLIEAGVDGIEIYEAEIFARSCERRWLLPLWGDVERARAWLKESNIEAVSPVMASNACQGHDNHWFGGETMHGAQGMPRGATQAL